jgi:8-oxo-dGTP pyrophosphatase MutT (NUDIX family)
MKEYKDKTLRAGIIPFYKDKNDKIIMLFMKPSNKKFGGNKFQIAKGKIDKGENPLESAIREAKEELGLIENNIKWIKKAGIYLDNHHIFIAEVINNNSTNFNTPHYETGDTKWMQLDEFMVIGRELHIPIIKKCYKLIKQELY